MSALESDICCGCGGAEDASSASLRFDASICLFVLYTVHPCTVFIWENTFRNLGILEHIWRELDVLDLTVAGMAVCCI